MSEWFKPLIPILSAIGGGGLGYVIGTQYPPITRHCDGMDKPKEIDNAGSKPARTEPEPST